jgi:hypothetical protein
MDHVDETTPLPRLRGVLKMMASHCPDVLSVFGYDAEILDETQTILQSRRKRRAVSEHPPSRRISFEHLIGLHRYVCFFIVQGSGTYYSSHSLALRQRLAAQYHDSMTTFVVSTGTTQMDTVFCRGTGFASLPSSPILLTLLNIFQVPTIVVVDTTTGRPISSDAGLAMEWNDAHGVINAWQRGSSGLTLRQKSLAILTCQSSSSCLIL